MKAGQTAVAWDAHCLYYVPIEELKGGCVSLDSDFPPHKLRRRVGWICKTCDEELIFFNEKSFKEHGHDA